VADVVQFVDSVQDSPTIRLDLSDGTVWTARAEGTDLSPPPMRRSVSTNMISDGDTVSAAAYADRVVTLSLVLETAGNADAATQIQLLARELDRPTNILRWQPDGAAPMFLRTKRSPIDEISSEIPPIHTLKVPILCEPFAVGPKEVLAPVVVSNDPSTGCNFNVDYPKGDVETPLYLSFAAGDVIAAGQRRTVLATRRRGNPAQAPWIIAAQSMTRAANTTLPGNDPLMSGTGSNYARLSTLTTTPVTRLTSSTYPAAPSVDVRGRYRCYIRYRKSSAVSDLRLQLLASGDGVNTVTVGPGLVVLDDTTAIRWADMGTVQLPIGDDPAQDGVSGIDLACRGVTWLIQAVNFSGGSPTLDVDCLVFVPADDRLCRITWPSVTGPTAMVLDSSSRPRVYGVGSAGETYSTQVRGLDGGGTPMVSPGQYNRITMLLDAGLTSTAGDAIANSMTVTPYYWPRYLGLRPPTT
jgi:hypothetical protein